VEMQSKKALVIETDLFFTTKIGQTLEKIGLDYLVTANSAEVFKLIKENEVVLIIFDLCLEKMDTITLLEKLKSSPSTEEIPVIGFGDHSDSVLSQARAAGCEMVVSNRNFVEHLKDLVEASLVS
jgi:CheY-like chemotaxis protein